MLIQDQKIKTLTQSVLQFQAGMYEATEINTVIKILSRITDQIHQYAKELNEGIHNHKHPYILFSPPDLKSAWQDLTYELNKQNLMPIFSKRPSQLYELGADYYT